MPIISDNDVEDVRELISDNDVEDVRDAPDDHECDSCKAGGPCTGCAAEKHPLYVPQAAPESAEAAAAAPQKEQSLLSKVSGAVADYGPLLQAVGNPIGALGGLFANRVAKNPETAIRSGVQGATMRFADEMTGATLAPFTQGENETLKQAYRREQQDSLANYNTAAARDPILATGSEMLGGMATPGLGISKLAMLAKSPLAKTAVSAGAGALFGAAGGVGGSEGSLLGDGSYGQVAADALQGAGTGALLGGLFGGIPALAQKRLASKAKTAGQFAEQANEVGQVEGDLKTLKTRQGVENQAAKRDAEALASGRATAQRLEQEITPDNALRYAALEGKQQTMGGPARAKVKAERMLQEPFPGKPGSKLLVELHAMEPEIRLDTAKKLSDKVGADLQARRAKLQDTGAKIPRAKVVREFEAGLQGVPSKEKAAITEQISTRIDDVEPGADDLSPDTLQALIDDMDNWRGTPSFDNAVGRKGGRVVNHARKVFANNIEELYGKKLPDDLPEFKDTMKRYGVLRDAVRSATVKLERANAGQPQVRGVKVEPKQVPEPKYSGGEEELAQILAKLDELGPGNSAQELADLVLRTAGSTAGMKIGGYPAARGLGQAGGYLSKLLPRKTGPLTLGAKVKEAQRLGAKAGDRQTRITPELEKIIRENPKVVMALVRALQQNAQPEGGNRKSATPGVSATMLPAGSLTRQR